MAMPKLSDYLLENPLYSYGQKAGQQGMQTTPVQSWQEGLARMLQGGLGGLSAAVGMSNAKEEQGLDQKALASAMQLYSTDSAGARAALASRPNLSETAAALMMQDAGLQKQIDFFKAQKQIERQGQREDMESFGFLPPGGGGGGGGSSGGGGGMPSGAGFQRTLGGFESTNNPRAVNPTSGAAGEFQFMPPTWQQMRAQHPDLNLPASPTEAPPELQAEVEKRFRAGNAQSLQMAGLPVTSATLYLAHRVGADGAKTLLQADPNAPMHTVVPPKWVEQNPDMRGTVGDFIRQAQQRFPQEGAPARPAAPPPLGAPASAPGVPMGTPGGAPAPGQPGPVAAPPAGDTVTFQGLQLPRAALAGAMMITDQKERQKRLSEIVNDTLKFQREGAPVERVRMPDGTEKIVPRPQAAGMVAAANIPPPGSKEGDVDLLINGDPTKPEYAAAYNRQSQPQQSQSGQLLYPDMSAYRKPPAAAGGVEIRDTPASQFQMANKLADDFNQLKPVKDYREVVPIFQSMQETAGRNDRISDLNLVYGLAKLMDPTSVVREGEQIMVRNAQGLPDWLKGMINGANGGSAFVPEQRARIMREAESRVSSYKQQYDGIAQQFTERAQRFGLDPRNVLTTPSAQAPAQGGQAGGRPIYDINGRPIK